MIEKPSATKIVNVPVSYTHLLRGRKGYMSVVARAIRRSAIALSLFVAILVALAYLVLARPTGFLPEDDQGFVQLSLIHI